MNTFRLSGIPKNLLFTLALVLSTQGTVSHAGEVAELRVVEEKGVYHVRLEMRVDASPETVYRVLTDFTRIHRLNPAIRESEVLTSLEPGVTRVRTLVEDCILLHCVRVARVEEIREGAPGHLHVDTDPESSDFRSGSAHWWIRSYGERTTVVYEASMEPDFFLPPVVGRMLMKRGLRNGIVESVANLERIARQEMQTRVPALAALDAHPD